MYQNYLEDRRALKYELIEDISFGTELVLITDLTVKRI
jgi:hypothetical protein